MYKKVIFIKQPEFSAFGKNYFYEGSLVIGIHITYRLLLKLSIISYEIIVFVLRRILSFIHSL